MSALLITALVAFTPALESRSPSITAILEAQGYMEGAIESGERAAPALLARRALDAAAR